jgi:hypothetical protein
MTTGTVIEADMTSGPKFSSVTSTTGRPVRRPADADGSETVAEVRTNTGDEPYRAQTRRRRRRTWATWEPKTPR